MGIENFSSLLEVSATLNIAFVAVEYAKAYTHTLSEKVFKFNTHIHDSSVKCMELLVDQKTLNEIKPVTINGKTTNKSLEELKRKREQLTTRINNENDLLNEQVKHMCESKSMSTLSLFLFLYCITSLYISGFEEITYPIKLFWSTMTIATSLYLISGWIFGEYNFKYKLIDFTSLRSCIAWFGILFVFSLIFSFIFSINKEVFNETTWNLIVYATPLLSYANFVAFYFKVKSKAKRVSLEIDNKFESLNSECEIITSEANRLIATNEVDDILILESTDLNE